MAKIGDWDESQLQKWLDTHTSPQSATAGDTTAPDATVPIGGIIMWPLATLPATGEWVLCDGSAIDARYAEVRQMGITTTPDMRGRTPVGKDSATFTSLLGAVGVETVTLTAAQSGLPTHTHAISGGHFLLTDAAGFQDTQSGPDRKRLLGQASDTLGPTGGAQNAASSHSIIQPSRVLNFIMRVR